MSQHLGQDEGCVREPAGLVDDRVALRAHDEDQGLAADGHLHVRQARRARGEGQ